MMESRFESGVMKRGRLAILVAALPLLMDTQPAVGRTLVLETPPDARTEAMGRAFSVLDHGPFSAWGNVGGLAFARGFQVSGSRATLLADLVDDATYYYASSLCGFNAGGKHLVVDVSLADYRGLSDYFYSGYRGADPGESVFGIAGALRLNRYVGVGIGLKRVSVSPGVDWSASPYGGDPQVDDVGPAFDGGLLTRIPVSIGSNDQASLDFLGGLTFRNAGPSLERERGGDPESLPHEVTLALGGEFRSGSDRGFEARGLARRDASLLSFSAGGAVRNFAVTPRSYPISGSSLDRSVTKTQLMGGAEASLRRVFFVRAGYLTEEALDIHGWTYGGGLAIRDQVGFDVASMPQFWELDRVTKLSLWLRIPGSPGGGD